MAGPLLRLRTTPPIGADRAYSPISAPTWLDHRRGKQPEMTEGMGQMTTVDRSSLRTTAQLLAKAESTDIDAEAIAFVERSYRLLAQIITAHDTQRGRTSSGPRRRERRHLQERRDDRPHSGSGRRPTSPGGAYRGGNEARPAAGQAIDLSL